jgi:hypothetical protein
LSSGCCVRVSAASLTRLVSRGVGHCLWTAAALFGVIWMRVREGTDPIAT